MRINYQERNVSITETFRLHAEPRIQGLSQYSDRITDVKVVVSQQRHLFTVEITVNADGTLIRGEDRSPQVLASFDKALDRVERQLRRNKDKLVERGRRDRAEDVEATAGEPVTAQQDESALHADQDDINIVRTKSHVLKPMTPEEAVLQMDMLGHDFFVFFDGQTERVGVVYKRHDGDYGLIEPEIG